jgi:hypothetical protein
VVLGVLARVPQVIDHAVVGAEQVSGGWVVVMRDVSAGLVGDDARLTRDDSRRVLAAAAALHARFWDGERPGARDGTALAGAAGRLTRPRRPEGTERADMLTSLHVSCCIVTGCIVR